MKTAKNIRKRGNPVARALRLRRLRPRIVRSRKLYTRKGRGVDA